MTSHFDLRNRNHRDLFSKNVQKVYSGRPGCMCGCNGRYWDNDGDNDRQVARLMNELFDNDGKLTFGGMQYVDDPENGVFWAEKLKAGRVVVIYFNKPTIYHNAAL